jgi:hypothetical protein
MHGCSNLAIACFEVILEELEGGKVQLLENESNMNEGET